MIRIKPALDCSVMPTPPETSRVTLAIEGMHCASCVATIEEALSHGAGVTAASVDLATARAQVVGRHLNTRRLIEAVLRRGYYAKLVGDEEPKQADHRAAREFRLLLRRTLIAATLTLPVFVVSIADIHFPNRNFALLLLTLPVYLYAGWPFLRAMARTFHHHTANMNMWVGLVATSALLLSVGSTFFPRAFASAGAAHAYYATVGFITTLRLSVSFWIGGFGASLSKGRQCPDCALRGPLTQRRLGESLDEILQWRKAPWRKAGRLPESFRGTATVDVGGRGRRDSDPEGNVSNRRWLNSFSSAVRAIVRVASA